MRVHFIVHESFEAPGAYETWAINQGHDVTYSRVYAGDRLPDDAVGIDFLVVMGGPQDPDTTLEACPHFNAKAEQALIASAVKTGKAVIGICLGSQLIGEALGAPFSHSPEKEIGKFPITLTEDGRKDEMFSHFGKTLEVGHWHNDMPGLRRQRPKLLLTAKAVRGRSLPIQTASLVSSATWSSHWTL